MSAKRKIAVAIAKSSSGINQRIELMTVADMVHLFALAMGYHPQIAFAFGVISRSVPEVQAGECDIDLETATKAIRVATMLNQCRVTHTLPPDCDSGAAVLAAVTHVHTVENAYTELCSKVPGVADTFAQQYNDWAKNEGDRKTKRESLVRRCLNYITRK